MAERILVADMQCMPEQEAVHTYREENIKHFYAAKLPC